MPVKVTCSTCEKTLNVPDTARGKAIRCPGCQSRIAVPGEAAEPAKAAAKPKPKKAPKPADSEMILASLDFRKAEDKNARICSKCGFDMKYVPEEETECPECGYDGAIGGQGAKARKKAMKGPDPADFYPGLFSNAKNFVFKNIMLAWRTMAYTLVSLLLSLFFCFAYLWITQWPPRIFLALCGIVCLMIIPGWLWILDVEIIKLTLERKDKFKKLNFDFFLSSAMGFAFAIWCLLAAVPIVLLPTVLGYFFVNRMGGRSEVVFPICCAIGVLPTIWFFPVVMAHMSMVVQYKGWMIWEIVPIAARNFKPLCLWFLWFMVTNIPAIAGIATIAIVYGNDLISIVEIMESNAAITREEFYRQENPNTKKKGQAAVVLPKLADKREVSLQPAIVPSVILAVMCLFNGFTCMFLMRINGLFTYYFKNSLNLIDRRKEYKYKAKEQTDELDEDKPKTTVTLAIEGLAFHGIFAIFGMICGYFYGFFTAPIGQFGEVLLAAVYGGLIAQLIAWGVVYIQSVIVAFKDSPLWGSISLLGVFPIGFLVFCFQKVEERMQYLLRVAIGIGTTLILLMFWLLIASSTSKPAVPPGPVDVPPAAEKAEENGGEAKKAEEAAPATAPK